MAETIHNDSSVKSSSSPIIQNLSQFDAVLFSAQIHDRFNVQDIGTRIKIQSWRQPHQRFVFFMMESQSYSVANLRAMNGFFNWTMTFRWDSDLPRPYGWFDEIARPDSFYPSKPARWIPYNETRFRESLPSRPKKFLDLARRPGKVAWIVSHCDTASQREDYVYQLRKYIPVDVFGGKCIEPNSPTCDQPYSISRLDNCTRRVQQHYKFYLAFENQFCNDYVTEKFFQRMEHSVVITLGQANYSNVAPPHSSISVFDFESAKDLAAYLHELDREDARYLSYFWWKDFYRVHNPRWDLDHARNNFGRSMCRLCEKLHDEKEPPKVYHNLYRWWRESAECGKRLHGLTARMANDPALPGFRSFGGNTGNLDMFARNGKGAPRLAGGERHGVPPRNQSG